MLEASKSLVFLSYWSFAKVHGPCIQFVEALMKARSDLDRSAVSEVMDSVKRKVKDENLTDRKSPLSHSKCVVVDDAPLDSTRTHDHEEDCHPRGSVPLPRALIELEHIRPAIYSTACRTFVVYLSLHSHIDFSGFSVTYVTSVFVRVCNQQVEIEHCRRRPTEAQKPCPWLRAASDWNGQATSQPPRRSS